ncbi:uncharacterized protein LOC114418784 isoform X2 [Glycine soja]|uniref:uncharacterized protein LOC114418784 isoform X2 n=1 Tax=Glycine soja TaxID=3848 RepID=UPI0002337F05|nr:uncharacterized protein LOC114418784 isoform X2 [Glycine soja]
MVEKEMEDPSLEVIRKWIKGLSDGTYGQEFTSTTRVIRLVKAHKGFILCDLIIHSGLLDENGNWHVSAIATLVDIIASFTSYSVTSCLQVTLDLSISYYSTAKLQEEVEVEAKVIRKKDELISVIVEVRKKHNGELVALGKLWMVARKNPRK